MKALQLVQWGHEAELREVPQPDPGPGQVLVRIGGAGACHSDLHLMHDFADGMLPFTLPFTLGHENAGWVEAVGAGVTDVRVGEAVAVYGPWGCGRCHRCASGAENYCERQQELGAFGGGLGLNGGMAPFLLVPDARWLVPLGDLDPVNAAPLTDAALTPYHAIKAALPVLIPGSVAVVIGAGGLGHMAVQLLSVLCAAQVVAVDNRRSALDHAARLGADRTVLAGPDAVDDLLDATGGRGADAVFDLVGAGDTLALAAAVARPMGRIMLVGLGGGTLPVGFFSPAYEVSVASTYWGTLPELIEVVALAQTGAIASDVHRVSLDQAVGGYRALRAGEIDGRVVVVPES